MFSCRLWKAVTCSGHRRFPAHGAKIVGNFGRGELGHGIALRREVPRQRLKQQHDLGQALLSVNSYQRRGIRSGAQPLPYGDSGTDKMSTFRLTAHAHNVLLQMMALCQPPAVRTLVHGNVKLPYRYKEI